MLLYVCLVLGMLKSAMGSDNVCDTPVYTVCKEPNNWQFPETEEQLYLLCRPIFRHLDCLDNYLDNCGSASYLTKDRVRTLKILREEICQRQSNWVLNFAFLSKLIRKDMDECHEYASNKTVTIADYSQQTEIETGDDKSTYNSTYHCLMKSIQILCFVRKFGERYGYGGGATALEVLGMAGDKLQYCSYTSKEKIEELLALLELERREKRFIRLII